MQSKRWLEDRLDELITPLCAMADRDDAHDAYMRAVDEGRLKEMLASDIVPFFQALDAAVQSELWAALEEALGRADIDYRRVLGRSLIPDLTEAPRDLFAWVHELLAPFAR